MAPVIDSHQHFWDRSQSKFDYSWQDSEKLLPIRKNFMPEDLAPKLEQTGVDYSVFVQTQHNVAENRWALELANANKFVAGVVGWVDLASDHCESQLEPFVENTAFVGIRHVVQDEPNDDFIVLSSVLRGLTVLERHEVPYDLLFYSRHLKHAAAVADHCRNLKLVIDHLSKPDIQAAPSSSWRNELAEAARRPNVWCKLSGMLTEATWQSWSPADLKPFVDTAIDAFGPERLMFGSDWPVCLLAGSYQQVFDALKYCIVDLSDSEQDQILGKTAIDFYQLRV